MKDFGMFSDMGNVVVGKLVEDAIEGMEGFDWVCNQLHRLALVTNFEEATDTAVREAVYQALEKANAL